MAIIKFQVDDITTAILDYDEPVYEPPKGSFGEQWRYGCNAKEDVFYATKTLHTIIQTLGMTTGDRLEITKQAVTNSETGKSYQEFIVNGMTIDKLNKGVEKSLPQAPASISADLFDDNPLPTLKDDATFNEEIRVLQNDIAALKIWIEQKVKALEDGAKSEPVMDEDIPF